MSRVYPFFSLFIALIGLFSACSLHDSYLDRADSYFSKGNYESALTLYYQYQMDRKETGRSLAGIGRILSTSRISVFSGLNLLERGLAATKNPQVRLDLFYLYLDLGRYSRAGELLSPESLGLDLFYRPDFELLRKSIGCFLTVDPRPLIELADFEPSGQRDHGLVRCYVFQGKRDQARDTVLSMEKKGMDLWFCRSLAILQEDRGEWEFRSDRAEQLAECRTLFPGDIVIRRDRPLILRELEATPDSTGLFEEIQEIPPYTEHTWHPYWKAPFL